MNFNIMDFGAIADGSKMCTEAFDKAIAACAKSGGGYVDVPVGTYLSGSIELKSNVYLRLSPGANIIGSMLYSDYRAPKRRCMWYSKFSRDRSGVECRALIFADRCENTGIVGHGTINGRRGQDYTYGDEAGRPFLVVFAECTGVKVTDVTLRDSGMFVFYGLNSKRVIIDRVTVLSSGSLNGDGLDFDGGKDVIISNCYLETGDDSIGLKTLTENEPCENFVITNCVFHSVWAGIRLGPETAADMRNITVSNCVFDSCNDGLKIQVCNDITFEDLMFTNLNMRNVVRPIFMTNNHFNMSADVESVRPKPGRLRRVLFNGIYAQMSEIKEGSFFQSYNSITGLTSAPVEDVTFKNVHITSHGGGSEFSKNRVNVPELLDFTEFYPEAPSYIGELPSSVLFIKNANNIKLDGCTFTSRNEDKRYSICAEAVDGLKIIDTEVSNSSGLLRHIGCQNIRIIDSSEGIWELDGDLAKKWHELREEAVLLDEKMDKWTVDIDLSKKGQCVEEYAVNRDMVSVKGKINKDDRRTFVYLPEICGQFSLYINGKLVDKIDTPQVYWHMTCWASEVTDLLNDGENDFDVVLESVGGMGGIVGDMPFGTGCDPVTCGFYAPVEVVKL